MVTLKIDGHGIYRNSLYDVPFSYDEMVEVLKSQKLSFPPNKSAETFPAPSMSKTFYSFIFSLGKMPTQKEFCDYFLESNKKDIEDKIAKRYSTSNKEDLLQGLFARAARTYPSLVRDLHFSMFLKNEGWDVLWNPIVDVDMKTDMVVNQDGKLYGVAMYTDTKRGMSCRARKLGETDMPKEFTKIELPLKLDDGQIVGNFKLYGPKQAKQLELLMAKA